MNVISINTGEKNDFISFPFINHHPSLQLGKKHLFMCKFPRYIDYAICEITEILDDSFKYKILSAKRAKTNGYIFRGENKK
jgi:hypothetical protein